MAANSKKTDENTRTLTITTPKGGRELNLSGEEEGDKRNYILGISGETFLPVTENIIIGSDKVADVTIEGHNLSPFHCKFYLLHNILYLMDLGSESGTTVQRKKMTPGNLVILEPGNQIRLGKLDILVHSEVPLSLEKFVQITKEKEVSDKSKEEEKKEKPSRPRPVPKPPGFIQIYLKKLREKILSFIPFIGKKKKEGNDNAKEPFPEVMAVPKPAVEKRPPFYKRWWRAFIQLFKRKKETKVNPNPLSPSRKRFWSFLQKPFKKFFQKFSKGPRPSPPAPNGEIGTGPVEEKEKEKEKEQNAATPLPDFLKKPLPLTRWQKFLLFPIRVLSLFREDYPPLVSLKRRILALIGDFAVTFILGFYLSQFFPGKDIYKKNVELLTEKTLEGFAFLTQFFPTPFAANFPWEYKDQLVSLFTYTLTYPIILIFSHFLFGVSLSQFLLGIKQENNRIMAFYRCGLEILLAPFLIFDIPCLFNRPTFKESLTGNYLVSRKKKLWFVIGGLFYLPAVLIVCFILPPLWEEGVLIPWKKNAEVKWVPGRFPDPPLYGEKALKLKSLLAKNKISSETMTTDFFIGPFLNGYIMIPRFRNWTPYHLETQGWSPFPPDEIIFYNFRTNNQLVIRGKWLHSIYHRLAEMEKYNFFLPDKFPYLSVILETIRRGHGPFKQSTNTIQGANTDLAHYLKETLNLHFLGLPGHLETFGPFLGGPLSLRGILFQTLQLRPITPAHFEIHEYAPQYYFLLHFRPDQRDVHLDDISNEMAQKGPPSGPDKIVPPHFILFPLFLLSHHFVLEGTSFGSAGEKDLNKKLIVQIFKAPVAPMNLPQQEKSLRASFRFFDQIRQFRNRPPEERVPFPLPPDKGPPQDALNLMEGYLRLARENKNRILEKFLRDLIPSWVKALNQGQYPIESPEFKTLMTKALEDLFSNPLPSLEPAPIEETEVELAPGI